MRILSTLIIVLIVLYLAFVALNTYLYHEKQADGATLEIQWGI